MSELLSHPVFAIIFLIGLLVFVHEFGHFIVGKAFGIGVETFSIGFGPKLIGFQHKDTQYRISWLPLGGFVKFAGALSTEDVPEHFRGKEFYNASFLAQTSTVFAGPLANLLLAVLVYSYLGAKGIEHPAPIIGQIRQGSPAELAGLRSGDKVTQINGQNILTWTDLQEAISSSPDEKIQVEVLRKTKALHFEVKPEPLMLEDMAGRNRKQGRIGIGYGFLPPVLDLLPGASLARTLGVQSGLSVSKLKVLNEEFSIKTWDEFLEALNFAYEKKADSFTMELGSADKKTLQTKTFKTDPWWKLEGERSPRQLAHSLGITDSQMTIATVEEPASPSLQKGDRILGFEGQDLLDIYAFSDLLQKNEKEKVHLNIQRQDALLSLAVQLKPIEIQKPSGKAILYTLPVTFGAELLPPPPVLEIYPDFIDSMKYALRTTLHQSYTLFGVVVGLLMGEVPLKVLGGPIMIAKIAGDSAKLGLQTFLSTLPLISINLGVLNLLPIPALDGGKLVMITMERVLGRRLKPAFIENFHKVGFVMLLGLIVLAAYNDLSRFWSSILRDFVGFFK